MLTKEKIIASVLLYFLTDQLALSKSLSHKLPFNSEVPISKRLEVLKEYFSPSLNQVVELDPGDVLNFKMKKSTDLSGYISVSPPKGTCFIITRRQEIPDERICKTRSLRFDLSDLDSHGSFHWTVKTGPEDFGTVVRWNTPYRVARMVRLDMQWPGPVLTKYVSGCEATRTPLGARQVYVYFLDGETWTSKFPDTDELAWQTTPLPNLFVETANDSMTFSPVESKPSPKKKESHGEGEEKKEAKEESKEGKEGEGKNEKKQNEPPPREEITWQIAPRNTYRMSSRYFSGQDSLPKVDGGECRYRYEDAESSAGLMECHFAGSFKWLYLPLICLPELRIQ